MGSASYRARKRAQKKEARKSARETKDKALQARSKARRAVHEKRSDPAAAQGRRELEDAYVDAVRYGGLPGPAENPSYIEFLRTQARSMSDDDLKAFVNLSSGADDDDEAAMGRDMDAAYSQMMRMIGSVSKRGAG